MDIGCIFPIGRNKALVDKLDNFARTLIKLIDAFFVVFFLFKRNIQNVIKIICMLTTLGDITILVGGIEPFDIGFNVFSDGNAEVDFAGFHQRFDIVSLVEVTRIIDKDFDALFPPIERNPQLMKQEGLF